MKEQGKKALDESKKTSQKLYQDTKTGGQKMFDKFFKKKETAEDEVLGVVEEVAEDVAEAAEEAK